MSPSDFSDELLKPMNTAREQVSASQELRDAVLSRTTRTIRNRRRIRRAGFVAAFAACYVAGIATMSLWRSASANYRFNPDSAVGVAQNGEPAPNPVVRKLVRPEDDQIADASVPPAARLTPYERLCRTGDQLLQNQDDVVAATRTYKKALQLASSDQRTLNPDHDTWLMMALKQSVN